MNVFANAHLVVLDFDFHELRFVVLIESEGINFSGAENAMNLIANVEFDYNTMINIYN